jgi:polyphosphate kinase
MTVEELPDIEPYEPSNVDLSDPELYLNRELSELAFQQRVLQETIDERCWSGCGFSQS